jgi:hypothetical protein
VRIRELDKVLFDLLSEDHPEITNVELLDKGHSRLRVDFAGGAKCTISVREVSGPGVPGHKPYELPEAVF